MLRKLFAGSLDGRAVLLLLILCSSGCGDGSGLVPVEGKVTLDGAPLGDATVTLLPTTAASPGPFAAKTDAEGRYKMATTADGDEGAAPGEYFLMIKTVIPVIVGDESTPQPTLPKEIVPPAYSNGTMKITIPPEGSDAANFDMLSR